MCVAFAVFTVILVKSMAPEPRMAQQPISKGPLTPEASALAMPVPAQTAGGVFSRTGADAKAGRH